MQERPHLEREKALARENLRKATYELMGQIAQLLSEDEQLGTPYREGREIILPICKKPHGDEDKQTLRSFVDAWVEIADVSSQEQ